jgi:ABC-type branched-subunit amino acid transport system substrate-binding protein
VGAALAGVLIAGCGGGGHASAGAASAAAASAADWPSVAQSLRDGTMVVVLDEPAAGSYSEQNASIAKGAAVAVAQINAAGGLAHGVRIKLESQALDGLAEGALKQRLSSDAAAVLILPCDTESQAGLAARAAQFGMLTLAPCDPDPTVEAGYSTYWPVGSSGPEEAAGLTRFMHTLGYTLAYTVRASGNQLEQVLTNEFRAAAKKNGVTVDGGSSASITAGDIAAIAKAIKALRPVPGAVFTTLPPPSANELASGLQAQGVEATVVGTSAMDTPLTLKTNPQALESALVATYGFVREEPAGQEFVRQYTKRFGLAPVGGFPGLGFEAIRLIATAVAKGRAAAPVAIQRALLEGLTVTGVALAERRYLPRGADNHVPVTDVSIEKVYEGKFEPMIAVSP